jgi:hypothetical protein
MDGKVSNDESAEVVKNFKDTDEAHSHAKAQKASHISNKRQNCYLLIAFVFYIKGVFDEDGEKGNVSFCVVVDKFVNVGLHY